MNRFMPRLPPQQQSPLLQYLRQIGALTNTGGNLSGNSGMSGVGGDLSSIANIVSGIQRGGVPGYLGAGINAARLGSNLSGESPSPLLGAAGSALGLYNNLKQGGAGGDAMAAVNAGQLYGTLGGYAGAPAAGAVGAAASEAALPIGMLIALHGLFEKNSQYNTHDAYVTDMNNAAGIKKAAQEPYNQPGNPWTPPDLQADLAKEAQGWINAAQESAANPGAFYAGTLGQNGLPPIEAGGGGGRPSGPMVKQVAEGGRMPTRKTKSPSKNLSKLRHLYEGSYAQRQRFDDGGSVYSSYYNNTASAYNTQSPQEIRDANQSLSGNPSPGNIAQFYASQNPSLTNLNSSLSNLTVDPNSTNPYGITDPNNPDYHAPLQDLPTGAASDLQTQLAGTSIPNLPTSGGGGGGSSTQQNLSGLLQSLGLSSGMAGGLTSALPLLPLLAALVGKNSGQANPVPNPTGIQTGNIAPIAPPTNPRQYLAPQMSQQDWYTYGQRPETSFYSNNRLPPIAGLTPGSARGGHLPTPPGAGGDGGPSGIVDDPGVGDGTSDDVPARLSGGEYVMDANSVSLLGNGSNEAGARRLEQLRQNVRKHAGKKLVKGQQFTRAKPPAAYMRGAGGQ